MKQRIFIVFFLGLTFAASAQKSKVIAVTQMIDAGKYDEAKEAIELALLKDKTSHWARTYYTKGLLCQTAYEAGVKGKDKKKTNLYPDQLYVAYDSYEKALELDARGKLHAGIGQKYYTLANDFRSLGQENYLNSEYEAALRAFEHALFIGNSELISAKTDTNLIFNTAIAAYESSKWEKAIQYLTGLHEDAYSPSTSLLLAMSYLEDGDTLMAEDVMMDGLELYHYEDSIVMYLVNQMAGSDRMEAAIEILDKAIEAKPENFRFYWARGLIYRRMNNNDEALKSFLMSAEHSPEDPALYYHIGICYYNMGIDLRESALQITENSRYREVREQYLEEFREAVKWFKRSYELNPFNEETVSTLYQLYDRLQMKEEKDSLQHLLK